MFQTDYKIHNFNKIFLLFLLNSINNFLLGFCYIFIEIVMKNCIHELIIFYSNEILMKSHS
jgi:hypothetical protein